MNISDLDPADISIAGNAAASPQPVPSQSSLSLSQLNPDDVSFQAHNENEAKHGGLGEQVLTGIESAGRAGTLGASDFLENQLAKMNPQLFGPDARRGRVEANPGTAFGGALLGGGALIAATGGLAAPAEGVLGAGLAATALGTGAEGALFGAGNVVSDYALGDPNLNAQKVLTELGTGFIGGAILGTGLSMLSKRIGLAKTLLKGADGEVPEAASEVSQPVIDLPKGEKPTSLEEMDKILENLRKYGDQGNINELPQKSEAMGAIERLGPEMQIPITDMQLDSLSSQDARNQFKTMLDVPGKSGETLRNWQGAQKKDLTGILDKTIENVAPGYEATTNAADAGERVAEAFTKVVQGTRDELGPAFQQIKSTALNDTDHLPGIIEYLTDKSSSKYANPKIANMFDTGGDVIDIKPYKTNMGIDKATYSAVKQAVESLQENPEDFEKLIDIRKGLSQNVEVTKLGDAPKEIGAAKAAMMDYIQDAVQSQDPDLAVRETFANWAKNEQNAQMIEKKFGAEIGSGNFRSLARGKADESIVKKIFSDSETVSAVKNILPSEEFDKLVADHLSILRNDATDKGVFSSNKFFSKIRANQYALNEAFMDKPELLTKMKDSLTLLRIFADDTPQNPSGTTKTLLEALFQGGLDPFAHAKSLGDYAKSKFAEQQMATQINSKLAGTAAETNKLSTIQGIIEKVDKKIGSEAKSIFGDGVRGATLSGITQMTDKEFDTISKKLGEISSNPENSMDHFANNTQHLYQAAPNITQGVHASIFQGAQFLQSKLPQPPTHMPFSPKWTPSIAQKNQFNKYYQAVNNPIGALKQVRTGMLDNQTIEALEAVHPQLLSEMRAKVMTSMTPEKTKKLSYPQRISLGKFLGQPMDENMVPAAIQSNQAAMSSPNMSQQTSQAQGAKTRSSLGGLKQLDVAGRAASRTHRVDD